MFTVGVTGGVGSGKSTVAKLFAEHGVPVIDTDRIAHELTEPGCEALDAIRAAFGESVFQPDGYLDRAALRRRIFADVTDRRQLESILHPRIRQAVQQSLAVLNTPYVLVVIPLLVETGQYQDMLDRILVVDCTRDQQIARVMSRNGLVRDEVEAILNAQAGRTERLAVADDVIDNSNPKADLRDAVATLHARYLALAGAASP